MSLPRRKSVSNEFEPNLFISLSLRVLLAVLVGLVAISVAKLYTRCDHKPEVTDKNVLRYWGVTFSKWNPKGSLRSMDRVFEKLGYKFANASHGDDWDVLWSFEYPFSKSLIHQKTKLFEPLFKMNYTFLPHQRVNHFPGIAQITNKVMLGTQTKSKYILPTFTFPDMIDEFDKYVMSHPSDKFIEKNYNNRGVQIVALDEIEYDASLKIYQPFMANPFLIDGHAFDFGVYVLITSVNPLRIYRYATENFIRFCPEEYQPFDAEDTDKYVVDGDHLSAFEMPSFEELYENYGYSFKLIFEHIIREKGFSVEKFWQNIDDAISTVILQNEKHIIKAVGNLNWIL